MKFVLLILFNICIFFLFCVALSNELLEREVFILENSLERINTGETLEDILHASNTISLDLLRYNGKNNLPSIKVDKLNNQNRKSIDEKYASEIKRRKRSFINVSESVNSDNVTDEAITFIPLSTVDLNVDINIKNFVGHADNRNHEILIESSIQTLDHTSQLFGQISDNISIATITSSSVKYNVGTIYAAILCPNHNKNGCEVENYDIQSNIIAPLSLDEWPGQEFTIKEYIKERLYGMGYTCQNETKYKNLIHDFLNYFSLELNFNDNRSLCFCSVYNKADDSRNNTTRYLLCFTSKIDDQNSPNSYWDDVNFLKLVLSLLITTDIFLFLTLIIYLTLPELRRNVHGKCMVMYLFSMVISYFGIILTYLPADELGVFCDAIDQTAISIYFFSPYGCMVVANFVMFLVTLAFICRHTRVGRESFRNANYRKSNSASQKKEMFLVHLTLPFIMGLDKIYEFVFLIRGQTKTDFWIIPDLIFSLIGFYVFLVLVCKPRVIRLLGQKLKRMASSVKSRGFCTSVVISSPKMNQPANVTSSSTECFI